MLQGLDFQILEPAPKEAENVDSLTSDVIGVLDYSQDEYEIREGEGKSEEKWSKVSREGSLVVNSTSESPRPRTPRQMSAEGLRSSEAEEINAQFLSQRSSLTLGAGPPEETPPFSPQGDEVQEFPKKSEFSEGSEFSNTSKAFSHISGLSKVSGMSKSLNSDENPEAEAVADFAKDLAALKAEASPEPAERREKVLLHAVSEKGRAIDMDGLKRLQQEVDARNCLPFVRLRHKWLLLGYAEDQLDEILRAGHLYSNHVPWPEFLGLALLTFNESIWDVLFSLTSISGRIDYHTVEHMVAYLRHFDDKVRNPDVETFLAVLNGLCEGAGEEVSKDMILKAIQWTFD